MSDGRFVVGKTRITRATRLWPQTPTRVDRCDPTGVAIVPKVLKVGEGIDVSGPCTLYHTSVTHLPLPGAEEIKD